MFDEDLKVENFSANNSMFDFGHIDRLIRDFFEDIDHDHSNSLDMVNRDRYD